jgi:hypothetical protein
LRFPEQFLIGWKAAYFAAVKRLSNEFDCTIGWAPATNEF